MISTQGHGFTELMLKILSWMSNLKSGAHARDDVIIFDHKNVI